MTADDQIASHLAAVRAAIGAAAAEYKGPNKPNACTLVAVSKGQPVEKIVPALRAGQRVFGENRVQEAAEKWPGLRAEYPDAELHLIGGLQTNKVKQALALFDVIQTLDRPKLARAIAREVAAGARSPRLFVQVNTGEETQKGGVVPGQLEQLLALARGDCGLDIEGLMCIPPAGEDPTHHFALLAKFARRHGLKGLSMGMSGDYELAARMGATHVRVGTAIFGMRQPAAAQA